MSEHFNRLTPQETEALAFLSEECGEIIQAIGKILRHGFDSTHPNGGPSNRVILENEIGDVAAAVDILRRLGMIRQGHVDAARDNPRAFRSRLAYVPTQRIREPKG